MNEKERNFVNAIINYKPPFYKRSIVTRKNIDYNSPESKEQKAALWRAEEDTRELVSTLAWAVNSYSISFDEIIEAVKTSRKGYTNLDRLAYSWIDMLSNADDTWVDDRNRASAVISRKISNEIRNSKTSELLKNGYFPELDRAVLNMHKTSVQSATNLFLRVLNEKDNAAKRIIKEEFPSGYIRLRMI